jgi:hypothetical protein
MQFPAFLFGDEQSVVDAAEPAGIAWAESYQRTWTFAPAVESMRTIQPGELIVVHDGTLDPFTPRWRLFGASFAITAGKGALPEADREAFATAASATPWGALAQCIRLKPPNTVSVFAARVRALLAAWSELATLRYIGSSKRMPSVIQFPEPEQPSIGLDALVNQLFSGPLTVWGPQLGAARARLEVALDTMAKAPLDEVRARLAPHMTRLARERGSSTPARYRSADMAAIDPERISAALDALPDDKLEEIVPGISADLMAVVYSIVRKLESS